jgi:bifunctional DNase/RNase
VIDTLGGKVQHILVSDLHNDTFFAKIIIQVNGDTKEIDARPSDAMALAVRIQVPIFAEEAVMDKAGILLDKETGKPLTPERANGEGPAQVDEEELRRMSAFTDFINDLDLEDFGRQQSGGA